MKHRVVIIGSGFGGLFAAKALEHDDVEVTLIARTAQHLFQPLLYQVATGILSEGDIAPSTREILRRQKNVQVLLGLVDEVDVANQIVRWRFHERYEETPYDSLIVATGAGQSYFGNDHFATFAPGMKSIDDALELRARIFQTFEMAELESEKTHQNQDLTFVVVGAGPTGVEMAGQIRELATDTLKRDFRTIDPTAARVLLVDAADQVLPPFGKRLGKSTQKTLEKLGVEVRLNTLVTDIDAHSVELKSKDGQVERIKSSCKVWAAGVQGNRLGAEIAEQCGAEVDRAGRVTVESDCSMPGHPEVFIVGDLMSFPGVPGVAQGAIQSGKHAAKTIIAGVEGKPHPGKFEYWDKGSMATISRYRAVVKMGKVELTGFIAWVAWLFLHLLYIAGFKQRITTLMSWFISFITYGRGQRAVTNQQMVGRLAMETLGAHSSGPLMRGEEPPLVEDVLEALEDLTEAKREATSRASESGN